jgi:hypothetical protein
VPEAKIASDAQIAAYAINAGFPQNEIETAVAIALAESSGNIFAVNTNANGTTDRGLWQINSVHKEYNDIQMFVPDSNAQAAFKLWQAAGGKWTDWSSFNSGRYRLFSARAKVAAGAPDSSSVDSTHTQNGVTAGLSEIGDLLGKAMNPKVWASVALIGLGAVILIIVAVKMVATSPTVKKIAKTAISAVPGGGAVNQVLSKGAVKGTISAVKTHNATMAKAAKAASKTATKTAVNS